MSRVTRLVTTIARSARSKIANVFKNPNTQDTVVTSSSELGVAAGKKILDGGSKNTPTSPSPYMILNPDFVVEEPRVHHHSRPLLTISASHKRPTTTVHTSTYSADLQPQFPEEVFRGDGGDFRSWKRNGNEIGASMIVLHQKGFAQPFFSDHSKVAIVLQGSGTAGLVLPNDNLAEKVVAISAGDVIPVPSGMATWWFNSNSPDLTIVFLAQHQLTDFYLAGTTGVLHGFSPQTISVLPEAAVAYILSYQTTQGLLLKLAAEVSIMPLPNINNRHTLVLSSASLPLLNEVGFGVSITRLGSGSTYAPAYACATKFQIIFIFSGSGHVEVVGPNGGSIIDAAVETGHLFLVPNTGVLSAIAGDNGLRWLSIVDTPTPRFTTLVGQSSLLKSLSSAVVQGAFYVDAPTERMIRSPLLHLTE